MDPFQPLVGNFCTKSWEYYGDSSYDGRLGSVSKPLNPSITHLDLKVWMDTSNWECVCNSLEGHVDVGFWDSRTLPLHINFKELVVSKLFEKL